MSAVSGIIVPSSPDVLKKIKDAVNEASASWTRIDGENDFLKNLFDDLAENTELSKGYLKKLAKLYHNQNLAEIQADQDNIVELYEKLFGSKD